MQSVQTLCSALVDYAGLFPPAKLDMGPTVANYAAYVRAEHAWMLARLICPVARLDEFEAAAATTLPTGNDAEPWRISALTAPAGADALDADLERILIFNEVHDDPANGAAVIDAIELRAASAKDIDDALDRIPEGVTPFFELDHTQDLRGPIAALAGADAGAKVRTGGVTPDLIPSAEHVARFIATCAHAQVSFKATAGLHHPVRAEHALTYEPNAVRAVMHGFLNVFLGAALLRARAIDEDTLRTLLEETDPHAFTFDDEGAAWRGHALDLDQIAHARDTFAMSFGSCSFTEPVEDLQTLNLL
ncbi:MAG: hypothetical protein EA379_11660 [Phycisphaerales bacterium]|nr:MAG: hypothetical protein EA379_11660 [Phycisphaerales bacterium]